MSGLRPFALFCLLFSTAVLAAEKAEETASKAPALYHKISPSLVANVQGKARYIRCDVQLMTRDEDYLDEISLHTPAIRHELLLLLSDQKGKELKNPKGKEKLRKVALKAVRATLKELTGSNQVEDLYFTSFYVQ